MRCGSGAGCFVGGPEAQAAYRPRPHRGHATTKRTLGVDSQTPPPASGSATSAYVKQNRRYVKTGCRLLYSTITHSSCQKVRNAIVNVTFRLGVVLQYTSLYFNKLQSVSVHPLINRHIHGSSLQSSLNQRTSLAVFLTGTKLLPKLETSRKCVQTKIVRTNIFMLIRGIKTKT